MALIEPSIPVYDYRPSASPSVIGEIGDTAHDVNITVWLDGVAIAMIASQSGCQEIDDTGFYAWSMQYVPAMAKTRQQYHWQMSDGNGLTADGDFILKTIEKQSKMPSLSDRSSYIVM